MDTGITDTDITEEEEASGGSEVEDLGEVTVTTGTTEAGAGSPRWSTTAGGGQRSRRGGVGRDRARPINPVVKF